MSVQQTAPLLDVVRPADLPQRESGQRWLVDQLWPAAGAGIIGGAAKSFKSWLALELAVAVATGTPCLGRFRPQGAGYTLVYAAEDSLFDLRTRLAGLCSGRGLRLEQLGMGIISVPRLLLDRPEDRDRLDATVARLRPRLLVLDPFVRLHSAVDENSSADVAAVLGHLRALQRAHDTAVVLVHHARKHTAGLRAGQALRGSSDFHAWTDVTLYMERQEDRALLTIEHRAAPSAGPLGVRLSGGDSPHLELADRSTGASETAPGAATPAGELKGRVLNALQRAGQPVSGAALRQALHSRNQRVADVLRELEAEDQIVRRPEGWTSRACS
jgi:hypothetical protein